MATDWDLRAFLFGLEGLDDAEKELCYSLLDGEGFSATKKRRAFFALNDADLQYAGIRLMSTRKVLRLAIAGAAAGLGSGSTVVGGVVPAAAAAAAAPAPTAQPFDMAALKEALEEQEQMLTATMRDVVADSRARRYTVNGPDLQQGWDASMAAEKKAL